jgi:hypothetical protein
MAESGNVGRTSDRHNPGARGCPRAHVRIVPHRGGGTTGRTRTYQNHDDDIRKAGQMSDRTHDNELDQPPGWKNLDKELTSEAHVSPRQSWRWPGRGRLPALATAAVAGVGALVAALALPAAASTNPWQGAQVGLTYAVYQPKTVLGLPRSSFKLLPCPAGQDDNVYAAYGAGDASSSSYGRKAGFSISEGYPSICSNPGTAKQVGIRKVGIPYGTVKVSVSVYCDPAQFKSCTTASGVKNGYVLQWSQPNQSTPYLKRQTQMFVDTSQLTLTQALHIVGGVRSV